ncbi:endonuclease domain-containing protein [Branchiibius cervicis]|uniref:Endonuclease domain-containing protein n=1 Tax=Branchiibius cervicis TaxID=908252 RepID=A0ABW2AW06_9MICO
MDLTVHVRRAGGIVPTRALRAAGFSDYHIRQSLDARQIHRVRKGWVAVADVDRGIVQAVRSHGVLSCISEAARVGLWTVADGRLHIAVHSHTARVATSSCVAHWSAPTIPRDPDAAVDPIENVLVLVAQCQSRENALAAWEAAFRRKLVTPQEMARLPLPPRARDVLAVARLWADSGLESITMERLRWLKLRIVPQAWIAGHWVDLLIGDRLVLQIDGAQHVKDQREKDIAHDARLVLMGYTVIRVSYRQIMDDWPSVQHRIMQAVAQGLHVA